MTTYRKREQFGGTEGGKIPAWATATDTAKALTTSYVDSATDPVSLSGATAFNLYFKVGGATAPASVEIQVYTAADADDSPEWDLAPMLNPTSTTVEVRGGVIQLVAPPVDGTWLGPFLVDGVAAAVKLTAKVTTPDAGGNTLLAKLRPVNPS
jgi:hypothetical protein